MGEVTC